MNTGSGRTVSVWMPRAQLPVLAPLPADTEADVCVIGAGIAGVLTAHLLARAGKSVVVLDDGGVASGETARTTAHLVTALDDRFFELERLHGDDGAKLAAASHSAAIDLVESLANELRIDCGFERLDGYLFAAPPDDIDLLERERDAARKAGLAVDILPRTPFPSFEAGPCVRFPRQGQMHPLRFLAGVVSASQAAGVRFHRAHAAEFVGGDDAHVTTSDGRRVAASALVVATNTPVNDRVEIHTKQAAYRSYVVAMQVPRGVVKRALYWDTGDSYHYIRLEDDPSGPGELLIVGGEDHRTGQAHDGDARFAALEHWTRGRFPVGDTVHRWSGQVWEPVDRLGLIGRNPGHAKNVYVATGDSGNGMTHGAIAGMLLSDLVLGRENPWEKLYDPARKTLLALPAWVRENAGAAPRYADWVAPGEVKSVDEIAPGTGAVLRRGLHKVAACRDADGTLHEVSAACPHLGGVVCWNATEKTWDCPLHGSRFDAQGTVVSGPANRDLGRAAPE